MSILSLDALCEALFDRSTATSELIKFSFANGIGVSEETITDINLVEIHRRLPEHVLVRKFNKREENSLSGADWLWTIGGQGRWLSIAIQAKLVRPGQTSVRDLHHGNGRQRERLERFARDEGLVPLYVVYSAERDAMSESRCAIVRDSDPVQGCAIVQVARVKQMFLRAKGRTSSRHLLHDAVPLPCIACCMAIPRTLGLADAVATSLNQISREEVGFLSELIEETEVNDSPSIDARDLIRDQPSRFATRMLQGISEEESVPFQAAIVISSDRLNG